MNGHILQALRLSMAALGEATAGQVVNLMSNDVNRFDVAVVFLHYLWIGPIETFVVTYFMWNEVGPSAAIGVASLLLFIPLQGDNFSNMNCIVLLYNRQHNKFVINRSILLINIWLLCIFATCFDPAGSSSGKHSRNILLVLNCITNVDPYWQS
jgi:hypothetical protein